MRRYRAAVLAAALGILSILPACCGINLNRIYDIYLNAGFLIPCIYGGIFQGKYSGLCACITGLTPFFLPNHHGFANLVPAAAIILWNMGHNIIWKRRNCRRRCSIRAAI